MSALKERWVGQDSYYTIEEGTTQAVISYRGTDFMVTVRMWNVDEKRWYQSLWLGQKYFHTMDQAEQHVEKLIAEDWHD